MKIKTPIYVYFSLNTSVGREFLSDTRAGSTVYVVVKKFTLSFLFSHALFRFKSSARRLLSLFSGDHYDSENKEELVKLCFLFDDEVPIV